MNVRDDMRCDWTTAGTRGMRCMCPATMPASKFCAFHRHPDEVDCNGIVAWSQDATADEYLERVKAFAGRRPSPHVERLRAQIDAHRSGKPVGILSSRLLPNREPGQDEDIVA